MELDFRSLRQDSALALEALMGRIQPDAAREALVCDVRAACLHLHTLGVASLLVDGYPKDFFLNLGRAGESWRRLLALLRKRDEPPPPSTWNEPLLGAVAAGHWELAQNIAKDSATRWQPESGEYEDDFDWAVLLRELVASPAFEPERTALLLSKLGQSGTETYSERMALVEALRQRNGQSFFEAFEATRLAHGQLTEKLANSFTTHVEHFAPYRYLWFEGLALLRLGERAGLQSHDSYLYCPPLARVTMTVPLDGAWIVPLPE